MGRTLGDANHRNDQEDECGQFKNRSTGRTSRYHRYQAEQHLNGDDRKMQSQTLRCMRAYADLTSRRQQQQGLALHLAIIAIQMLFGLVAVITGSSAGGSIFKLAAYV